MLVDSTGLLKILSLPASAVFHFLALGVFGKHLLFDGTGPSKTLTGYQFVDALRTQTKFFGSGDHVFRVSERIELHIGKHLRRGG